MIQSLGIRKRSTDDANSEKNKKKKFDDINSLSEEGIESEDDGEKSVYYLILFMIL